MKIHIHLYGFIIYKSEYEKIRIGSPNDGGYIISDLPNNYELFITLAETHYLIHFHPNTVCSVTTVPNVFEATYVRKDCQSNIGSYTSPIRYEE